MDSGPRRGAEQVRAVSLHTDSPWRRRLAVAVTLGLLLLAAYANSFHIPFLLDDEPNIVDNFALRRLDRIEAWFPEASSGLAARPVLSVSFALNYALHGLELPGYHAVNLAALFGAVLAMYGCVRRTLRLPGLRERFGADAWWLALAAAALWAVHPLNTASVSYLTQRAESLAGMLGLAALYCFIRGLEQPRAWLWPVGAVAGCLAAAMTKEVAIVFPSLLLAYDRCFVAGGFWAAWRARWRVYVPLFATCIWVVQSTHDASARGAGYGIGITWWSYGLVETRAVFTYLRLAFWPSNLVFDYGRFVADTGPATLACAGALLALVAVGVWTFFRHPRLGFLAVWFFAVLAPTSSIVPVAGAPIAENRAFLVVPVVVCLVLLVLHRLLRARSGWIVAALVVLGALHTSARNADYATELTLWRDTVEKKPDNARAWTNVGHALQRRGVLDEAGAAFRRACEVDPANAQAHANLAGWLVAIGRVPDAVQSYERALKLRPDRARYWSGFGQANFALGRLEPAGMAFANAAQLEPKHPSHHHNLGCWFAAQGRLAEARGEFEAALQLAPDFAAAREALSRLEGAVKSAPASSP